MKEFISIIILILILVFNYTFILIKEQETDVNKKELLVPYTNFFLCVSTIIFIWIQSLK